MEIRFPLGIESFSELREGGYYYVDKTGFIRELLSTQFKANLITRPRRFGKTLSMSMLEDFFDISRNSSAHFKGLKISKETDLCEAWENQWPVLFVTFKNVEATAYGVAYSQLAALISDYCISHPFLSESEKINFFDRELAKRFMGKTASEEEIRNSLYTLMCMLTAYYGKPVILLIDEYDVPLAKASENGFYPEMLDVIRAMLTKALKTNEFLKFAVVTGCLKIAKESIFTGTNNFVTDSISGDRFNEYVGFTSKDVEKLLEDAGFSDHREEVRTWYDGYHFGNIEVYCPWDVLNHAAALQDNPKKAPKNYWGSTSHNGIIYRFISRTDLDVNQKFERLLAGESIVEEITEDLTYDTLKSSETNLWSLLYLTGYLTRDTQAESVGKNQTALRIPNEEVKSIFRTAIVEWFHDSVQTVDRHELFEAMWNGDALKASHLISDLLFGTISYHDYKESYYHAFLAGIFAGAGYIVESNFEYGTGRPDVVVKDKKQRRALVLEAKHADSEDKLAPKCDEALQQIHDKKYLQGLERGYRNVLGYGVAFFEKECMLKKYE